ncbi:MAG: TIGR01906 family membrane protein [Anaerolineales bacterium]
MSGESKGSVLLRFLRLILIVTIPILLLLTGVRLTLTPIYVQTAYAVPGFPEDTYGFTAEQRLSHAQVARQYLLNDAGIEYLAERTFDDGEPLYNDRELRHMHDVKELTQAVLNFWLALLFLGTATALSIHRVGGTRDLGRTLAQSGKVTLISMAVLGVALLVSFPFVFVGFHRIFFEGNSWLFRYSDTLIRLFPERFWQQVFVFLTLVTAGLAVILRWLGSRLVKRQGDLPE